MLEPMGSQTAIEHEFELGRAFTFYFGPDADIKPADQLGYNGSTYVVRYVKPYAGFGPVSYTQVLTEQEID